VSRTVLDLVNNYRKLVVARMDNIHRVRNLEIVLSFFEKDIGSHLLRTLCRAQLNECRERLLVKIQANRKGRSGIPGSTANRYFQTFHCALSLARDVWGWEEAEGLPRLPKLKEPKPRTDFLSPEQRTSLLQACKTSANSRLYVVVVIAIATGMRRGEIQRLRWSKIDLSRGVAILEETKNGEPLRIKFGRYPLEMLKTYRRVCDPSVDLLFPSTTDLEKPLCFRTAWNTAHTKAGLPKTFVFHSLRHSFASDLAASGAQLLDIATLLNHKSINTTKRYAHLTREHTDRLVEKINESQFE
jgi:integrase